MSEAVLRPRAFRGLPLLFSTFHGRNSKDDWHYGATFDQQAKADGYPGPRMLECADKRVVPYVPVSVLWSLIAEWKCRLDDIEGDGPKMELEAAIGDLEDAIREVPNASFEHRD